MVWRSAKSLGARCVTGKAARDDDRDTPAVRCASDALAGFLEASSSAEGWKAPACTVPRRRVSAV